MQLSIIVPAFNEETRIPHMLDSYLPYFVNLYGSEFEFIVVVNGSVDNTENIVRHYAETYPQIQLFVEPHEIGKGGAIMLGFKKARGNLIGYVDADGSTPPKAFNDLVRNLGSAGAIIASRWNKESKITLSQPFSRKVASRIFNGIVHILFRLRISDTQCGAKLLTANAVSKVLPKLGITRWAFDVDLLFQLKKAGFHISEIPTIWHDVSNSRLRIVCASLEMLAALIRLRLIYSPMKWIVALYDRTLGSLHKI